MSTEEKISDEKMLNLAALKQKYDPRSCASSLRSTFTDPKEEQ